MQHPAKLVLPINRLPIHLQHNVMDPQIGLPGRRVMIHQHNLRAASVL